MWVSRKCGKLKYLVVTPQISYRNLNSDRKLFSEKFCILLCFRITVLICSQHTRYLANLLIFKSCKWAWQCEDEKFKLKLPIAFLAGYFYPNSHSRNGHGLSEQVYVAGLIAHSGSNIKASDTVLLIASPSMCLKYTYFEESIVNWWTISVGPSVLPLEEQSSWSLL